MARKTFTQAQEDMNNKQSGDYVKSFYIKRSGTSEFVKFLETDINKMEIRSVHNVAMTSPKTGKTYYTLVDSLETSDILVKESMKKGSAVGKVRDMVFIPLIKLYNSEGEFEPSYEVLARSVAWMANNLVGFEARYGLEGVIEVERTGTGTSTNYTLYDARKGMNGKDLPELPSIEQLKADFEVKDDDIVGRNTSLVKTWDEEMCERFIETGSPYVQKEEEKEEAPRRRNF